MIDCDSCSPCPLCSMSCVRSCWRCRIASQARLNSSQRRIRSSCNASSSLVSPKKSVSHRKLSTTELALTKSLGTSQQVLRDPYQLVGRVPEIALTSPCEDCSYRDLILVEQLIDRLRGLLGRLSCSILRLLIVCRVCGRLRRIEHSVRLLRG